VRVSFVNSLGLNPEQQIGATHRDGPLLILAGAGSGKTKVITTRIAWLIAEQHVSPRSILALTFTNKAAREMRERVSRFLPKKAGKGLTVGTFHAFCVQLLRAKIPLLGYREKFSIFDSSDRIHLITDIMKDLKVDLEVLPPDKIAWKISDAKNALVHAGREAENYFGDDLISSIYRIYQSTLKGFNILDFDDLLMLAVDLFAAAPEEMQEHCQRYKYILVDEYQDTNMAQYRLLRCMTARHDNICVVGDDDQSIYAWRGADIHNILNFEKDFPGTLVIRLEQNYRSTAVILRASNAVIANNTSRKGKKLWTSGEEGAPVRIVASRDEQDEAESVLGEILALRRDSKAQYSDMAIIFRTNFQTRPFEELFAMQSIPYEIIGGTKFFDRREVKDIVCYLRLMANRQDEIALLRVINKPKRGIGPQTIEKIVAWSAENKLGLYEVLLQADTVTTLDDNVKYKISVFTDLIEEYAKKILAARSMVPVVRELVHASGYEEELLREAGGDVDKFQKSQRWLQELYTSLHIYESDEDIEKHDLFGYIERISLLVDDKEEDKDKKRNAVTLMTMHSCKGLEFPHVFVCGVEEGNIPHAHSIEADTVEEERRLFYVAMTRAMKRLFLSYASTRRRYGEDEECEPSRFLDEIAQDCIEWAEPASCASANDVDLVAAFERMRGRKDG